MCVVHVLLTSGNFDPRHEASRPSRPLCLVAHLAMYSALDMQGKDKVHFAPHLDVGDVVVVKNAQHVVFTGKKWKQKLYRHHTG